MGKRRSEAALWLSRQGFSGDEQADRTHHGGDDRAVCHYPADHLPVWRGRYPGKADAFVPGAFGENISANGWLEDQVCVGDVFRLGEALIQVSQPRQPCWKVNARFGIDDLSRAMVESRRNGWLYRVLEPGRVAPGAVLERLESSGPPLPLDRLWTVTLDVADSPDELMEAAAHPALAQAWRLRLRTRAEWLLRRCRSRP
ncbi:MOSC domain-containing protein [Ectothiorhodospiraceae bacterium WFHF3C12]|nr:MOSC domain-containing protein [Ectothiorhodospiraceae bacterium WFHF3C12]